MYNVGLNAKLDTPRRPGKITVQRILKVSIYLCEYTSNARVVRQPQKRIHASWCV